MRIVYCWHFHPFKAHHLLTCGRGISRTRHVRGAGVHAPAGVGTCAAALLWVPCDQSVSACLGRGAALLSNRKCLLSFASVTSRLGTFPPMWGLLVLYVGPRLLHPDRGRSGTAAGCADMTLAFPLPCSDWEDQQTEAGEISMWRFTGQCKRLGRLWRVFPALPTSASALMRVMGVPGTPEGRLVPGDPNCRMVSCSLWAASGLVHAPQPGFPSWGAIFCFKQRCRVNLTPDTPWTGHVSHGARQWDNVNVWMGLGEV